MVPLSLFDVAGTITGLAQKYPDDLVITADQTGVHVNQPLPYAVPLDETSGNPDLPDNFVTFTTDAAISSPTVVKDYDSYVVVTETVAYVLDDGLRGEMKVYDLPQVDEPVTISREVIDNATRNFVTNPIIQQRLYLPVIAGLLLLTLYPMILVMRIFTLAIFAAITWVIVKIFMNRKALSYGQIFQISIHSLTPVIIIAYVLGVFSYLFFHGWLYFLAYLGWTLFVISKLDGTVTATAPIATPPVAHPVRTRKAPGRPVRSVAKTKTKKAR